MNDDMKQIVVVVKNENVFVNNLVKICVLYTVIDLTLSVVDTVKKFKRNREQMKGE